MLVTWSYEKKSKEIFITIYLMDLALLSINIVDNAPVYLIFSTIKVCLQCIRQILLFRPLQRMSVEEEKEIRRRCRHHLLRFYHHTSLPVRYPHRYQDIHCLCKRFHRTNDYEQNQVVKCELKSTCIVSWIFSSTVFRYFFYTFFMCVVLTIFAL